MNRKTIALCEAGYHPESEAKVINVIIQKCKENDINLLVFNPLMRVEDYPTGIAGSSNIVRGENEIYSLINYQLIDGLILFGNSFYHKETVQEIAKQCKKNNVPIINVNDPDFPLEHNVNVVNTHAMELVVEHLVKVHKFTRINFIGGYPDTHPTNDRLGAYKAILEKYNIPVEEDRIAYGHFWTDSVDCAKEFLKKDIPQAIVCANDAMAIFVSDYLKSEGYRIPKDIVVTGFDGISDAFEYDPPITTVQPRFTLTGEETFNLMMKLMNGESGAELIEIDSALIAQGSCGCRVRRKPSLNFLSAKTEQKDTYSVFIRYMVRSGILAADEQKLDKLFEHITEPVYSLNTSNLIFCIDEALAPKNQYEFDSKIDRFEIPKKLLGFIPFYQKFSSGEVFSPKQLVHFDILNNSKATIRFFSPLYFKNRNLGYISYEIPDYSTFEYDTFKLWAFAGAEKIGSFCLKRELELISIKDHLTGLYNRRGMEKYFEEIYSNVIPNGEFISLICVDIDYLKTINDKYGHEAGDNAIVQTSEAIKHSFSKNSIWVRTGGDEFCVLTHSQKKPSLDKQIEKLKKFLEDYNSKSGHPYKVQCSCGYFSLFSKDFSSFEEMQRMADANLYEVKAQHHNRRSTDSTK